jgi:hypothetical protein
MPDATGGAAPNAEDDNKPLTRADILALFAKELPGVVNAAVTSHTKRLQKSFEEKLAALAPKPKTEVEELEEERTEIVDPKLGGQTPKPKLPSEVAKPAPDPELLALRKKFEKLEKDNAESQKVAATERRQRLESDGHSAVRKALSGKVIAGSEDDVLALFNGRKAITIGDDGAVRLRFGAKDEPEDGHDISEGVAAFLKTPGAAYFTPPPNGGAGGAKRGTPPGAPARTGTGSQSDVEAAFLAKTGKTLGEALGG